MPQTRKCGNETAFTISILTMVSILGTRSGGGGGNIKNPSPSLQIANEVAKWKRVFFFWLSPCSNSALLQWIDKADEFYYPSVANVGGLRRKQSELPFIHSWCYYMSHEIHISGAPSMLRLKLIMNKLYVHFGVWLNKIQSWPSLHQIIKRLRLWNWNCCAS